MKRGISILLAAIIFGLMTVSAAPGLAAGTATLPGTWEGREGRMGESTLVLVPTTITFYENGTYNGTVLASVPVGGQWQLEDDLVLTDDLTMLLEDENTLIVYYGEIEIICHRKTETEGTGGAAAEAARTAAVLMEESFSLIDDLFQRANDSFDAVRQFLSDRQYASLLNARIRCTETIAFAAAATAPDNPFAQADQEALQQLGIDADNIFVIPAMAEGAAGDVQKVLSFCTEYLFTEYCYSDLGELMLPVMEHYGTYLQMIGRLQPVLGKMIFDGLREEPAMTAFWQSVPEKWPVVGDAFPANADPDSLPGLYLELNNNASLALGESNTLLDTYFASLQEKNKKIAAGEASSLRANTHLPDGLPVMAPFPDLWLEGQRIRLNAADGSFEKEMPGEIVLTVLETESDDYTGYMDILLPAVAAGTALEGSAQNGWQCEVHENGLSFRSAWNPQEKTARFWYDPSRMTFEGMSVVSLLQTLDEKK